MAFSNIIPSFVQRYPGSTFLATIALLAGVAFVVKAPTTGLPPTGSVRTLLLQNGSGATMGGCYDNGSCAFSGALKIQGVTINTGSLLSQGAADARYVNTSGDTMTGALKVRANMSGSTLNIDSTVRFASGVVITRSTDVGWSVQAAANQACNTTCVNACVFGEDTSVLGSFVSCSDATADRCLCAGGS